MGMPCKICSSERREYIEELILQGHSNLALSNILKGMGEDMSHACINRHKNKHMPDHINQILELAKSKCNEKYDKVIDVKIYDTDIADTVKAYADELKPDQDLKQEILNDALLKQLALVRVLQEKYINGVCRFPYEEIKALDVLVNARNRYLGIIEKQVKVDNILKTKDAENPFASVRIKRRGSG